MEYLTIVLYLDFRLMLRSVAAAHSLAPAAGYKLCIGFDEMWIEIPTFLGLFENHTFLSGQKVGAFTAM